MTRAHWQLTKLRRPARALLGVVLDCATLLPPATTRLFRSRRIATPARSRNQRFAAQWQLNGGPVSECKNYVQGAASGGLMRGQGQGARLIDCWLAFGVNQDSRPAGP